MAMSRNSSSKSQQPASLNQLETHQDHHLLKKPRPQLPDQSLKCPRCDSTNTKFCYYNNYSLSQPRYFCKSCRRYWTKGGTLRNIPFGGGCRKNRRSSSSSSSGIRAPDHSDYVKMIPGTTTSFCGYNNDYQIDLGLAFALFHNQPPGQLGFQEEQLISVLGNSPADGILGNSTGGAFGVMSGQNVGTENASYAIRNAGGLDHRMGSEPNKVLWRFPCQTNGESFGNVNSFVDLDQNDSGRESWNTNGMMMSTSWNGFLNTSPLI